MPAFLVISTVNDDGIEQGVRLNGSLFPRFGKVSGGSPHFTFPAVPAFSGFPRRRGGAALFPGPVPPLIFRVATGFDPAATWVRGAARLVRLAPRFKWGVPHFVRRGPHFNWGAPQSIRQAPHFVPRGPQFKWGAPRFIRGVPHFVPRAPHFVRGTRIFKWGAGSQARSSTNSVAANH